MESCIAIASIVVCFFGYLLGFLNPETYGWLGTQKRHYNGDYMGGCQNYGPFWGTLNNRCRIIVGTPKRDPNFDNRPYR